jgi:hypothetical protein
MAKQFSLKTEDTNLLQYVRQHQNAIFSGILSTMAITKFGYKVDEKTKFELSEDLTKVTISQIDEATATPEDTESAIKASK